MTDEGFLRRWARRKTESRPAESRTAQAPPAGEPGVAPPRPAGPAPTDAVAPVHAALTPAPDRCTAAAHAPSPASRASSAPLPTLDDVARLTADSDFSAFVARGVDAAVRRTALKKLFADPHFNAMDGLDVYIGDYTQPSPVSDAMLAQLAHARQVLRRTVDADGDGDEDGDGDTRPQTATHRQRQQPPEPGHDEYPPDRRTDDA